jgi:molecular chaperone DnaK
MASLNAAWTAASQDIYNSQQSAAGSEQSSAGSQAGEGQQQQGNGTSGENVTDVPYEEVK